MAVLSGAQRDTADDLGSSRPAVCVQLWHTESNTASVVRLELLVIAGQETDSEDDALDDPDAPGPLSPHATGWASRCAMPSTDQSPYAPAVR
eukprot:2669468-Rhodomonas_salina.9